MDNLILYALLFSILLAVLLVLAVRYLIKKDMSRLHKIIEVDSKVAEEVIRRIDGAETGKQVKAVVRDLGQDKPAIRFVNLRKYLELTGWNLEGHGKFTLISKTVGDVKTSILTPADESLPEYNDMTYNIILVVARVDGKDFLDLFKYLSAVRLDSMNIKSIQDLVL